MACIGAPTPIQRHLCKEWLTLSNTDHGISRSGHFSAGNHILKKEGAKKVTFSLSSQNGHPRTTFRAQFVLLLSYYGARKWASAVNVRAGRLRALLCDAWLRGKGTVAPSPLALSVPPSGLPSHVPILRERGGADMGEG
ncbi:hypothetical protein EDB83DRAFT_2313799 [Lactarius deliciosus]|nr:hypothetical protein EDB83DRAFT_2313799 [Lactarius deliciosus]